MSIELPAPPVTGECAACHTEMLGTDAAHICPDCGSVHHADCWADNHGCATFGCGQAHALAPQSEGDANSNHDVVAPRDAHKTPVEIAGLTLAGLAGLVTFGLPALGAGAWMISRKRTVPGAIGVAAGVAGIVVSGVWWLGWLR